MPPEVITSPQPALNSALYEGWLRHRRYTPKAHEFTYKLVMLWLDLDEIDRVFAGRWLWSSHTVNLAWWRRADHLGAAGQPLADAVRDEVERQSGQRPDGPIRLLTHPRYFGYGFNPISLYYCYAAEGDRLEAVLGEVNNTPWGERHLYVLPMSQNLARPERPQFRFAKAMHVSPFLPMDLEYQWRLTLPGAHLTVHMDDLQGEQTLLDATLSLERREITGASLARALLRYPFMTGQVMFDIHWQALRLWLKGVAVHDHPGQPDHQKEAPERA